MPATDTRMAIGIGRRRHGHPRQGRMIMVGYKPLNAPSG